MVPLLFWGTIGLVGEIVCAPYLFCKMLLRRLLVWAILRYSANNIRSTLLEPLASLLPLRWQ